MVGCTSLWYMLITGCFGTGWCMVDALVYGTGLLQVEVHVDAWFMFIGTGLQLYISQ